MTVGLIPVVELEPSTYSSSREHPQQTVAEAPETWDRHWRDCLRDWGIDDLEPYELGSWLVPVERLRDEAVLDAVLDPYGEGDEAEPPCALYGGFVLETDSAIIRPQCCGDLSNLAEWRAAAETVQPSWETVWIGHPCTHVRAEGDRLWFSQPSETPPADGISRCCCIGRHELRGAITEAQRTLDSFAARLRTRLARRVSASAADAVVLALVGGEER